MLKHHRQLQVATELSLWAPIFAALGELGDDDEAVTLSDINPTGFFDAAPRGGPSHRPCDA